jgi:hypothetical protein
MIGIVRRLASRPGIIALNLVVLVISLATLWRAVHLLFNAGNDVDQIDSLLDGVAVIFVAYGCALEERDSIMKFFKAYAGDGDARREEAINRACHDYGLVLLLLGLFMEVAVEVTKIPDTILRRLSAEGPVFGIGCLFCALVIGALVRHCIVLAWPADHAGTEAPGG